LPPKIFQYLIPIAIGSYLFGPKGSIVFDDIYQQYVLPSTSHLKARTALWGWVLPGIVLTGMVFAALATLIHLFR
jgi:hypothetical protein